MKTSDFLNLVHGLDALIYFQVGSKTWKHKPQTFHQAESKLRWRNSEGDDICFIVNGGGTKDAEINRVNAVFVDWDCGRDEQGRYFTDEVARTKKAVFLPELHNFTPKPSLIVETRNGFHAYWLLEAGVTVDQFRDCQRRLAVVFGSDLAVTNPARLLRLPGFDWVKASAGYARFHVQVIHSSAQRYRIDELLAVLPQGTEDQAKKAQKAKDDGICAHNKCECTYTLALIVGAERHGEPVTFPCVTDAIEYLKKQDLGQYLGLSSRTDTKGQIVPCPFHNDTNPSAGVYRSRDGDWMFRCHACGVGGTIIDVAMKILNCHEPLAVKHLFEQFKIRVDTGWKKRQEEMLQGNIAVLENTEVIQSYPSLCRLIRRIRSDLISKLRLARGYIVSERHQYQDRVMFFASLRHFHRVSRGRHDSPRYCNRQNEKVDRYCLLGLLQKLPDEHIPPELLTEARRRQFLDRRAYRIQCYSFPAYTPELLKRADERACVLIQAGASVRGISRELVQGLYGDQVAREVYPQRQTEKLTASTKAFTAAVEKVVLEEITAKGYTTAGAVRLAMAGTSNWPSVTERRIEKCLPGLLGRYGLKKLTCTRAMKERLGIRNAGYPKVIVPGCTQLQTTDVNHRAAGLRMVDNEFMERKETTDAKE